MGRFSTKFHCAWNPNFPMNLGFLRFSISKLLIFMGFYGPSILCCLYTQFNIIKKIQRAYAKWCTYTTYSVKNGIFQAIYRFLGLFISKSLVYMGFYGPSFLCCLYIQFGVFKISLEPMEGYAYVMRYAWKMDFLK